MMPADWSTATFRRERSAITLTVGRLVASIESAVWLIIAARLLDPSEFGELAVILGIGSVSAMLADLGVPFVMTDAVRQQGRVSAATLLFVIRRRLPAALVGSFVAGLGFLWSTSGPVSVPILFACSLLATVAYSTVFAAFRGLGHPALEACAEAGGRAVMLVAATVALVLGGGVVSAVAVYAAVDVLVLVAVVIASRRYMTPADEIDRGRFSTRNLAGTSVARFLAVVQRRLLVFLVAIAAGAPAAGLIAAPLRIFEGLLLGPRSLGALEIGRRAMHQPRRLGRLSVLAVAPVAIGSSLLAEPLIQLVFGSEYLDAVGAARLIFLAAIPGAMVSVVLPNLSVVRGWVISMILGTVGLVAAALTVLLTPVHGVVAAAWVLLGSETLIACAVLSPRLLVSISSGRPTSDDQEAG